MKILLAQMIALLTDIGYEDANKLDVTKANKKLQQLLEVIDNPKQVNPDSFDKEESKKLLAQIKAAHDKDKAIEVIADAEDSADEEAAPAPKAKGKPAKTPPPEPAEEPEPAAKPAKGKPAKAAPAPAAKPAKAKTSKAERDEYGSLAESDGAKINGAVTKKARTMADIVTAAGLEGTFYDHMKKMVDKGHFEKVDLDGKSAWKIAS